MISRFAVFIGPTQRRELFVQNPHSDLNPRRSSPLADCFRHYEDFRNSFRRLGLRRFPEVQ